MTLSKLATVAVAFLFAFVAAHAEEDTRGAYVLGPQDRLSIRVHTLRKNAGEAYTWAALTGEFAVGASGSVSMPVLGEIKAAGSTTAELANVISRTLKERADLAELPSASVEVLRYRPFYISGTVQQPGKYEFVPGLTILQAVSIAQGIARTNDLAGTEREMLTADGDLRALSAERIALEAQIARLSAEIADSQAITFPESLSAKRQDPRAARVVRDENLKFSTRREAWKAELEAIDQARSLLRRELASLEAKGRALDTLLERNRRELAMVMDLVSKGLAVAPRQLAVDSSVVMTENSRLDLQVATLRVQQSLFNQDREAAEIRSRYRRLALDEAAIAQSRLDQITEKQRTTKMLLQNAELRSFGSTLGSNNIVPEYKITRSTPSGPITRSASEGDAVEPGDVIQVSLLSAPSEGAANVRGPINTGTIIARPSTRDR